MRSLLAPLLLCTALAQPAHAIMQQDARWLLTRAGFTPTQAEITALAAAPSRTAAVSQLLSQMTTTTAVAPPAWAVGARPRLPDHPTDAQRTTFKKAQNTRRKDFVTWTVLQMLATNSPLNERLALFWHNHFTSQMSKVADPWLMWNQDKIIRQNEAGSFATMLSQMVHDPAMLIFLDQPQSTAKAPTANLARELMELFTLGEGHYTETDVLQVARALTGLTYGTDGLPAFDAKNHDNGTKTILGQTGNFGPDDVVRILLANPNLATFIVNKLWCEFVSPTPDPNVVGPIVASFRSSNYQLKPVLQSLLNSAAFWAPANKAVLVKSPAEFVMGAARELALPASEADGYASAIQMAGQHLFEPPNVRGYLTGVNWINTLTLAQRQSVAHEIGTIWQTEILATKSKSALAMMQVADFTTQAQSRMADQPILAPPTAALDVVEAQRRILSDPAYWLK